MLTFIVFPGLTRDLDALVREHYPRASGDPGYSPLCGGNILNDFVINIMPGYLLPQVRRCGG